MSILILRPNECGKAYETAVSVFEKMYDLTTGEKALLSDSDDGESDLVVIGSDAVNDFLMNEMLEGTVGELGIKYGTDDYCVRTYKKGDRNVLILAGGRGRSTIYAVYDYFERHMGCRYFWDGDVIPHSEKIVTEGIDYAESPRFLYRGLRYFAHRGLKRFQAEHWSFEDWKKELDFLMKKRLNFFMLRIGMDDVWQKAFPDEVPYPDGYRIINDEKGYDDRSDFWTLKFRGKLRKKVMDYAHDNDMMSPTDTGTMTHWYSRTPKEFLKSRKPEFLEQADNQYNEFDTGRVFDFRIKKNMDAYMHLTETMATEYDNNNFLFHTIGLGERRIFKEDRKNFCLKKLCYRRIAETLREKYPDSLLMLATWDFTGWWRAEEVREFLSELDPERTILLDYTSDGTDPEQSFVAWDVKNKFPWIFGLFHAYEPESELRGAYDRTDERLKMAADDPACKGMILWPELSHSDPLILEYLSENSWSPLKKSVEEIVSYHCLGRYGAFGERMNKIWQSFLPFLKLSSWGGYTKSSADGESFATESYWNTHSDIFTKPVWFLTVDRYRVQVADYYEKTVDSAKKEIKALKCVIGGLASIVSETDDEFIIRDSVDIARTVSGRFLNYLLAKSFYEFGKEANLADEKEHYLYLMRLLSELLKCGKDFSVYETLLGLSETASVNPDFERTIKENILNVYCRQYAIELIDNVFLQEGEEVFDWIGEQYDLSLLRRKSEEICEGFMKTPLLSMQKKPEKSLPDIMRLIVREIEKIGEIL